MVLFISDFKSANIHKWVAITLGKLGDFSDTTAKIQNSFRIKVICVLCLICLLSFAQTTTTTPTTSF
jgi:hypothetical protein